METAGHTEWWMRTRELGSRSPRQPNHLDSFFTQQAGLGPVPGIVVYGPTEDPSSKSWEELVWERVCPAWVSLAEQRTYSEGWSLIRTQEFTTKLIAINANMYAFLDYP